MTDAQLQTKLNEAFNEVLREWAEDDPDAPIKPAVAIAAYKDAMRDVNAVLSEVKEAHEDWLSSQEGPAFDEALARKCDGLAAVEAARALK